MFTWSENVEKRSYHDWKFSVFHQKWVKLKQKWSMGYFETNTSGIYPSNYSVSISCLSWQRGCADLKVLQWFWRLPLKLLCLNLPSVMAEGLCRFEGQAMVLAFTPQITLSQSPVCHGRGAVQIWRSGNGSGVYPSNYSVSISYLSWQRGCTDLKVLQWFWHLPLKLLYLNLLSVMAEGLCRFDSPAVVLVCTPQIAVSISCLSWQRGCADLKVLQWFWHLPLKLLCLNFLSVMAEGLCRSEGPAHSWNQSNCLGSMYVFTFISAYMVSALSLHVNVRKQTLSVCLSLSLSLSLSSHPHPPFHAERNIK